MPRFYFLFQDAEGQRTDSECAVLPDAEAAWYQAVRSARQLIVEEFGSVRPGHSVEIVDEDGLPVTAVPLEEVVGMAF